MSEHWLVRTGTRRLLWVAFSLVLAATVAVELVMTRLSHFPFEDWVGFNAVYGFGCCACMILLAKIIGGLLKRPENYYGNE